MKARVEAGAPCARCHQPIDLTLHYNHPQAFTCGHINGYGVAELDPHDPRLTDPAYCQPEHRGCGASHGNGLRADRRGDLINWW